MLTSMTAVWAQIDMTSKIKNPSFESDFTGWVYQDMARQDNNVFSIKKGTYYAEKWTGRGGVVGNALVKQTIKDLQVGTYRLTVAAQNIQEDTPTNAQTGAWIFANSDQTAVDVRKDYTLEFVLVSDQLTIGFQAKNASGNWIAVDNFRLELLSEDFETVKTGFEALIAKAELVADKRM